MTTNTPGGALPPPDFAWQIGKTAPSIKFVRDAEAYLTIDHGEAERLKEAIRDIKAGTLVLNQWRTVDQFLRGKP